MITSNLWGIGYDGLLLICLSVERKSRAVPLSFVMFVFVVAIVCLFCVFACLLMLPGVVVKLLFCLLFPSVVDIVLVDIFLSNTVVLLLLILILLFVICCCCYLLLFLAVVVADVVVAVVAAVVTCSCCVIVLVVLFLLLWSSWLSLIVVDVICCCCCCRVLLLFDIVAAIFAVLSHHHVVLELCVVAYMRIASMFSWSLNQKTWLNLPYLAEISLIFNAPPTVSRVFIYFPLSFMGARCILQAYSY